MVQNNIQLVQVKTLMANIKKQANKALEKGQFEVYSKLMADLADMEKVIDAMQAHLKLIK